MGCYSSRGCETQEETAIKLMENELGFCQLNLDQYDKIIRKYSNNNESITYSQLQQIINETGIQCDQGQQLFNQYFRKDQGYNRRLLQVFGTLLNERSDIQEKAKLVFEIYDESSSYTLDRVQINEMLQDIFQISLNILPSIHTKNNKDDEIKRYVQGLKRRQKRAIDFLILQLMRGLPGLGICQFVANFQVKPLCDILKPSGVRKFLQECQNTQRKPWEAATQGSVSIV